MSSIGLRRASALVVAALGLGALPLACLLTTDLDKLHGSTASGGGRATTGSGETGGGDTGGGGGSPRPTWPIAYASSADVAALTYDGQCDEGLWGKARKISWSSKDPAIEATCQLAWGRGDGKSRIIYGCCRVDEPKVAPSTIAHACVPYNNDGISYLFAGGARAHDPRTQIVISAWGHNCGEKAVAVTPVAGPKVTSVPGQLNKFAPVDGTYGETNATNAKGYFLEWALPLDPAFTTGDDAALCAIGLHSKLLSTDPKDFPLLSSQGNTSITDQSGWSACTFAPPDDK